MWRGPGRSNNTCALRAPVTPEHVRTQITPRRTERPARSYLPKPLKRIVGRDDTSPDWPSGGAGENLSGGYANLSSSVLAARKSAVSKPSVKRA